MTERILIPCPICHGSTKEIQGVLACIANCKTQFYGLARDKWYVGTEADLAVANAQITDLKRRFEQVSNLHLFSLVKPGTKMLGQDITDDMAAAYFAAGETPDEAWRAMWKAAEGDMFVNPVTNNLLKRCIEIAWERGFKGAHNCAPTATAFDVGTVIHVAFEELQRENPDMFKDLVPEQFGE